MPSSPSRICGAVQCRLRSRRAQEVDWVLDAVHWVVHRACLSCNWFHHGFSTHEAVRQVQAAPSAGSALALTVSRMSTMPSTSDSVNTDSGPVGA